jgi:CSLREA domain-containing protein
VRSTLKGIVVGGIASLVIAAPAMAKTYEVTKRADPTPNGCKKRDCSLREAIIAANAHAGTDKVVLPKKKTYGLSIANSLPIGENAAAEGDLDITDQLTLSHPGKGRAKIDANGIDRAFEVLADAPTTFKRLVIRGGDEPTGSDGQGGGIRSDSDVVVLRSSITANHASAPFEADGGGISIENGSGASLTVRRSAVTRNRSEDDGAGISFEHGAGVLTVSRSKINDNACDDDFGGGIFIQSPGTISRSSVSGNDCRIAAGIGIEDDGPVTIENSTISNNTADISDGGGLYTSSTDTRVANSTITGNRAVDGAGVWACCGEASLNAVTIARNVAVGEGGGLWADEPVSVENSLIALNSAQFGDDCFNDGDPFASLGHNLLGTDADCAGFDATGDFVNANPKLGQLKSNGGPTQTVALKKGSPAINKAGDSAPNKDQRGQKRGKKPDIGAYERVKKRKHHHGHH